MKKLAAIAAVLVLFSPALLLVGIGMIFSPGANASCATTSASGTRVVGPLPDSLEVTTADGQTFTLKTIQLTHAATIIQTGFQIEGVIRDGLQIALMSALTESNLWMPANTSVYADSGNYLQRRERLRPRQPRPVPDATPGRVEHRPRPHGPYLPGPSVLRRPQPPLTRGLLNVPNWQTLTKGEAAQAAEVSAYPDRYRTTSPSPTASSRTPRCPAGTAG